MCGKGYTLRALWEGITGGGELCSLNVFNFELGKEENAAIFKTH